MVTEKGLLEKIMKFSEIHIENLVAAHVRTKKVTQQIYLQVRLEDVSIHLSFLVMNGLNVWVILGIDTLNKKEMFIDFSKQQLCFEHEYKQIVVLLRDINKSSQGVIRLYT